MKLERWSVCFGLLASASLVGACGNGNDDEEKCTVDGSYQPAIDPQAFVAAVDNPLFPLVPGTKLVYHTPTEVVEVTVTSEKRQILGVTCSVVHDTVSVNGAVIEDTLDWFAQDNAGAVWYMGEDSKEMSQGQVVSTEGSWEAGVDGAKPGVVMPASPTVGATYRQEYYACQAEDMGEVLALDVAVTVQAGSFTGCLQTRDFTPLEPDVNERKTYCPGVGVVLTEDLSSGEREELVEIQAP